MKFFLFVTVFVILYTQGKTRPTMEAITLMLPTTIQPGDVITLNGVLTDRRDRINVSMLRSDNSVECQIIYEGKDKTIEAIPGVESYNKITDYDITSGNGTFTLELNASLRKPEINVFFNVDGYDLPESLSLEVKCLESLNSIVLKEGVEKINSLSFNFTKIVEGINI